MQPTSNVEHAYNVLRTFRNSKQHLNAIHDFDNESFKIGERTVNFKKDEPIQFESNTIDTLIIEIWLLCKTSG